MGERAQHLADRPRRLADALPNTAVIDRDAGQHKTGVAQPGEVDSDQLAPLLALAALRSEVGGNRLEVLVDSTGIHPVPRCTIESLVSPWCRSHNGVASR